MVQSVLLVIIRIRKIFKILVLFQCQKLNKSVVFVFLIHCTENHIATPNDKIRDEVMHNKNIEWFHVT